MSGYVLKQFIHLSISLSEMPAPSLFFILLISISAPSSTDGIEITILNNCKYDIWPGILSTFANQTPNEGGFHLYPNQHITIQFPDGWSGRVWGRQGCCFDEKTKRGTCQTGDCAGLLNCAGKGGRPPATVVQMTLGTSESPLHYYDVSLVDGFNVPIVMAPVGGSSGDGCGVAGCEVDLNSCCPWSLVVRRRGKVVGCKSACLASKSDRYCCTGHYATPGNCKPMVYGEIFKALCPRAYSFPLDDATGLMTCMAPAYAITFCPSKL